MFRPPRSSTLFPYTTLFRSQRQSDGGWKWTMDSGDALATPRPAGDGPKIRRASCKDSPSTVAAVRNRDGEDRKSTRLNSSHRCISYAVFCLKKKNKKPSEKA